jgi:cytosine deaminase
MARKRSTSGELIVMRGFADVPAARRFAIANATIPTALIDGAPAAATGWTRHDIVIADGTIERILTAGRSDATLPRIDLDNGMVWPCFVDMHTHLDKGHTVHRKANADGTFASALAAVAEDRAANWNADDVRRRMDFAIRTAYAHGTALIRTHIDSTAPQHRISFPVFAEMRAEWAGRIDLQAVPIFAVDEIFDDAWAEDLAATVRKYGSNIFGGVTYMSPNLDRGLDRIFAIAIENGFDIDLHVDETEDPAARSLTRIAETAMRLRFPGRVVVGHCCSLALQPDTADTIAKLRDAGIAVVSLPLCNMYLQDRHAGRTPRWRGVTLLHELRAAGVPVAVASDNTRDPFYAYGDLDLVEVLREAVRTLQLDHPIGGWIDVVAAAPAKIVGRPDLGCIAEGGPADLVLFRARDWTELLSRPQSDRTVLRAGRAIDRTLPDYRELDDLVQRAKVHA